MKLRAQGSTEYLVLLGAALLIALAVVGVLSYYPSMSVESKKTQGDLYWSKAYPIAVLEARGFAGSHILRVKNLDFEKIYIEGVSIGNNSATALYYGYYDEAGLLQKVQPNICSNPTLLNCSIGLSPGAEIIIQYTAFDEGGGGNPWSGEPIEACGLTDKNGSSGAYFNSLRKYAESPLTIHYSRNWLISTQTGSYDLLIDCIDYDFRCSTSQDCTDKYCFRSSCVQGMCGASC